MINLALLRHRGWRLLSGSKTCQDVCHRQWTLCPQEKSVAPPAIYLDGELDKITGVQEETTYTYEIQRIQGGVKEHGATVAYQIRDAQIHGGYVYKQAMKLSLTTVKESLLKLGEVETIPKAALACTFSGNRYFGHWMTDDLTLTLAAQSLAEAIRTTQQLSNHQLEYSHLLNIHATPVYSAQLQELIVIEDVGQNQLKRERYEHIRTQFKRMHPPQVKRGVMLLRGSSGTRRCLLNEGEVANFLKGQGFTIVNPEKISARELVAQALGAEIVVGVEGSQLVHGLFLVAEGGAILTLQPPDRFNNIYKDYTDCLGLKYSFVVGKSAEHGFEINLDSLARTLDQISSHREIYTRVDITLNR